MKKILILTLMLLSGLFVSGQVKFLNQVIQQIAKGDTITQRIYNGYDTFDGSNPIYLNYYDSVGFLGVRGVGFLGGIAVNQIKTYSGTKLTVTATSTVFAPDSTGQIYGRVIPRTDDIATQDTISINTDKLDGFTITALTQAITKWNMYGVPVDQQKLLIRIYSAGTYAIAWDVATFKNGTVALPTTTVAGKYILIGLCYFSTQGKWNCVAAGSEL